jgi:predicted GH43/DUF377 family glycosyl hydrolase
LCLGLKVTLLLLLVLFVSISIPLVAHADSSGQWIKYPGNPVLSPTIDSWDSDFTTSPVVLYDGAVYRMWYVGGHATANGIGYANSSDGITWKRYPQAVLSPGPAGSWDSSRITIGSVLWNESLFLMAYRGENATTFTNGAIGVAASKDGISWIKYPGNPVMIPGHLDAVMGEPFAIRWQTTYNMWYAGNIANEPASTIRIFYATSSNGIKWTKWPAPVLSPSSDPYVWDSATVTSPSVVRQGSNFGLWYTGFNQSSTGQIGYATSTDGVGWSKSLSNPILTVGLSGSWDSAGVEHPDVVKGANGYLMYYDGFNAASGARIGLAYPPENFTVPELVVPQVGLLIVLLVCVTACYGRRKR